jgi:N6-L-threonylcarbamoyladenine synthase
VSGDPVRFVLGIETSCDETAAAVIEDGRVVRSSVVSSQIDLHARYGGVVPEIAGRAHLRVLPAVVADALGEAGINGSEVDVVAATIGPGLIGSLLVGMSAAKALALVWDVPFVGVNHLEAHLYASLLAEPDLELPMLVLLVSGGHTMLVVMEDHGRLRVLGSTLDDAAGEAFDKVARYLGLGYPGGPAIDRLAREGDAAAVAFPRAVGDRPADFSFSGVKTAVINHARRHPGAETADVVASFQEAVVDVLVDKALAAADEHDVATVCLGGGVAANSRLRERFVTACEDAGRAWSIPEVGLCTDNAAMVAAAGHWQYDREGPTGLDAGAHPSLPLAEAPPSDADSG